MIGIHLGANYTRVAIKKDGHITMVREIDRDGNADRLASVVSFRSDKIRFGTEALKTQEREIIFDACREAPNYKSDKHVWHATRNSEGQYKVRGLSKETISQEEVISEILTRIRDIVVARYGSIQKVVLSYPTECTHTYQAMLKNAAHKADLNNVELVEERVAAAKSFYELSPPSQNPHYLMVFKFGAGSFGISVFEKKNGENDFKQLASTSDPNMGGEDITNLLIWYRQEKFNKKLKENEIRNKELRESCERVKSDLSYHAETKIFLDGEPPCDINRDGLETICNDIIKNIKRHLKIIADKIQNLGIKINDVLLVGGSTRLHFIRVLIDIALKNVENTEYRYDTVINPKEAIAMGCANYAASWSTMVLLECTKNKRLKNSDSMAEQLAVGIDLGTTFSCIGIWRNNHVKIIANTEGDRITPSYVSYKNSEVLVGKPAYRQLPVNPQNTVYDMKRLIGNKNPKECIDKNGKYWTFKVKHDPNIAVEININGAARQIKPEEISSQILTKLKESAENVTRQPIQNIVLTVPAYFDEHQKKATIEAAEMAGLNVLELISEPSAAAFAYGYDQKQNSNDNLLIFDLGGGTLDVVIVEVKNGIFNVLAIGGDTQLGGRDFDNALMDYIVDIIEKKYKKKISENVKIMQKLMKECIDLKHMLSSAEESNFYLGEIFPDIDEDIKINSATFNKICFNLLHGIEMLFMARFKKLK